MPSVSEKQHRFMQAIAHGMKPRKSGPSVAIAKEFVNADRGRYRIGGSVNSAMNTVRHYAKKYADGGDIGNPMQGIGEGPGNEVDPTDVSGRYVRSKLQGIMNIPQGISDMVNTPGEMMGGPEKVQPSGPNGMWTEEDEWRQQQQDQSYAQREGDWGASTALGMMGSEVPFAGEGKVGIFGGKGAYASNPDAKTALADRVKQAQKMTEAKASKEKIWEQTGTAIDPVSGELIHEIPDTEAALNPKSYEYHPDKLDNIRLADSSEDEASKYMREQWGVPITYPFKDVLSHPEFEKAYPQLANDTRVIGHDETHPTEPGAMGLFDPATGDIHVYPQSEDEMRRTLLHEMQHKVQFLEGMPGGGSWKGFLTPYANQFADKLTTQQQAVFKYFQKQNIQPNVGLDAMKTAIQSPNKLTEGQYAIVQKVLNAGKYQDLSDFIYASRVYDQLKKEAYGNYLKLAGEAQARNVEWRSYLDEFEARQTPPWESLKMMRQPVSQEELIRHSKEAPVGEVHNLPSYEPPPQDKLGFYSKADEITSKGPEKAPANQWIATLKNNGLKAEEDKYLGITDWLKDQTGPISKKDLQDHIRTSRIKLNEAESGGGNAPPLPEEWGGNPQGVQYDQDEAHQNLNRAGWVVIQDPEEMMAGSAPHGFMNHETGQEVNRWDQLPEHLQEAGQILQEPNSHPAFEPWQEGEYGTYTKYGNMALPGGKNYKELKLSLAQPISHQDFLHAHFENEPNIIAHARFDERMVNGRKTLHINELQSDWHQQGEKHGYLSHDEEFQQPDWDEPAFEKVPDAPYKKNWTDLMMKRLVRYAADHDFQQISWPGSAQTVGRIEHWSPIQQGGKWLTGEGGNDVTPVIRRYLKELPEVATKIGKPHGALVGDTKFIGEGSSGPWELKTLPITPALKNHAITRGFSDFKRGGAVKKFDLGGMILNPRQYRFRIGEPHGGGMPGVGPVKAIHAPTFRSTTPKSVSPKGMIHSAIPGRTDKIPARVKGGSYVLPADVVSGVGQGNSTAGAVALNKLFKMGPYGAKTNAVATSRPNEGRLGAPHSLPGMDIGRTERQSQANNNLPTIFAAGGVDEHKGDHVPIIVAGGEFLVPPEVVQRIGDGDMKHGHEILDHLVLHLRKKTIHEMKKLPGPKKK